MSSTVDHPDDLIRSTTRGRVARLRENAEPLGFDAEGDVELAAEVLEGDGRRQLHDLGLGESGPHAREQLVRHLAAGDGDGFGIAESRALALVIQRARLRVPDLPDLFLRRA